MLSEETRTVETRGYYQPHTALNQINEKISESAWKAKKCRESTWERERERARAERNMKSK